METVLVLVFVVMLAAGLKLSGTRWGRDRKYQLPPGWRYGWFDPEARVHPGGGFAIRMLRQSRPGSLWPDPPAIGVWNTETGALVHLLVDSGQADARWTPDGRHLVGAAVVEAPDTGHEDIEVTVYTWPALTVASEARLELHGLGEDTEPSLTVSDRLAAVMCVVPGYEEEDFAIVTLPAVERIATFKAEDAIPFGTAAFSPGGQYAAFVLMRWWSCEHDPLADPTGEPLVWATLHLVDLRERRTSEHPVLVRPPPHWQPGTELDDAVSRLAQDPRSVRFEDARELVFELPWGGSGRVTVPPPPEGFLLPGPAAPRRNTVA